MGVLLAFTRKTQPESRYLDSPVGPVSPAQLILSLNEQIRRRDEIAGIGERYPELREDTNRLFLLQSEYEDHVNALVSSMTEITLDIDAGICRRISELENGFVSLMNAVRQRAPGLNGPA